MNRPFLGDPNAACDNSNVAADQESEAPRSVGRTPCRLVGALRTKTPLHQLRQRIQRLFRRIDAAHLIG